MVWLFVVIAISLTKLQASQRANVFTFIAQYIYMYFNSKIITFSMFIQCVHLFYKMPIVSCGIYGVIKFSVILRKGSEQFYSILLTIEV